MTLGEKSPLFPKNKALYTQGYKRKRKESITGKKDEALSLPPRQAVRKTYAHKKTRMKRKILPEPRKARKQQKKERYLTWYCNYCTQANCDICRKVFNLFGGETGDTRLKSGISNIVHSPNICTTKLTGISWRKAMKQEDCDHIYNLYKSGDFTAHQRAVNGVTPLHLAVSNCHIDLIKLLLGKRADIESKNSAGETPLDLAISGQNQNVVDLILDQNIDNLPDSSKQNDLSNGMNDTLAENAIPAVKDEPVWDSGITMVKKDSKESDSDLKAKLKATHQNSARMELENVSLKADKQELEKQISQLQAELSQVEASHSNKLKNNLFVLKASQENSGRLELENMSLKADKQALEKQISQLQAKLMQVEASHSTKSNEIMGDFKAKIDRIQRENEGLQAEKGKLIAKLFDLETKRANAMMALKKLEFAPNQKESMEKKLAELKEKLAASDMKAKKQASQKKDEEKAVEREFVVLRNKVAVLQQTSSKLRVEASNLMQDKANLQTELASLVESSNTSKNKVAGELSMLKKTHEILKQEMIKASGDGKKLSKQVEQSAKEMAEMKAELVAALQKGRLHMEQLTACKKENGKIKKELEILKQASLDRKETKSIEVHPPKSSQSSCEELRKSVKESVRGDVKLNDALKEIERLRKALTDAGKERDEAKETCLSKVVLAEQLNAYTNELNLKITKYESSCEQLQQEYSQSLEEIASLKNKFTDLNQLVLRTDSEENVSIGALFQEIKDVLHEHYHENFEQMGGEKFEESEEGFPDEIEEESEEADLPNSTCDVPGESKGTNLNENSGHESLRSLSSPRKRKRTSEESKPSLKKKRKTNVTVESTPKHTNDSPKSSYNNVYYEKTVDKWFGSRGYKGIKHRTKRFHSEREAALALNELMQRIGADLPNPQVAEVDKAIERYEQTEMMDPGPIKFTCDDWDSGIVTSVEPSAAKNEGIRVGWQVVEVNGHPYTHESLVQGFESQNPTFVTFLRPYSDTEGDECESADEEEEFLFKIGDLVDAWWEEDGEFYAAHIVDMDNNSEKVQVKFKEEDEVYTISKYFIREYTTVEADVDSSGEYQSNSEEEDSEEQKEENGDNGMKKCSYCHHPAKKLCASQTKGYSLVCESCRKFERQNPKDGLHGDTRQTCKNQNPEAIHQKRRLCKYCKAQVKKES